MDFLQPPELPLLEPPFDVRYIARQAQSATADTSLQSIDMPGTQAYFEQQAKLAWIRRTCGKLQEEINQQKLVHAGIPSKSADTNSGGNDSRKDHLSKVLSSLAEKLEQAETTSMTEQNGISPMEQLRSQILRLPTFTAKSVQSEPAHPVETGSGSIEMQTLRK
eukprot:jgi/Hompol1/807/HPOL_005422-RA